jgi:2-polyprenyl-6-hydroxyphenyl methylase/3-demethylubiquinone-9 3-methyltransferase
MAANAARSVNNDVYLALGDRWYDAADDPVALLRAQASLHVPWVSAQLERAFPSGSCRVLDVGCGGGFIANGLALHGHEVVGVDVAESALEVAARHDGTRSVRYVRGSAESLPFSDGSFDAACAMDFFEHVDALDPVLAEIARVLVPGGRLFFHTFNRNILSFLVVIKGVEWFVRNVPRDMHLLRSFVKPGELRAACAARGMVVSDLFGCEPRLSWAFARMLATGIVPPDFSFQFTRRTWTGYTGVAVKTEATQRVAWTPAEAACATRRAARV